MKVVVCDYIFPNLDAEREELSSIPGMELIDARCASEEDVIRECADADAILNQYNYITPKVIDSLKKCKVISTYGIGLDRIDVEYATKRGIYVCNSPDYNKFEVCDHTVALVLALSRNLMQFDRRMRKGQYEIPYEAMPLHRTSGQVMGFVGFGRIGRQIAGKLHNSFGMKILAYDPFLTAEQIQASGGEKVELKPLMSQSDFVSINVALSKDSYHLISAEMLALMKPTAYLLNCARGPLVDEAALVETLRSGRIAGAALDTFENEPVSVENPLLHLDNVITTPHAAWYTRESLWELQWGTAHQVALVLTGQQPTRAVNFDAIMAMHGKAPA